MKKNISKFIAVLLPALLASQSAGMTALAIHDPLSGETQVVGASLSDQYRGTGISGVNYALCAGLTDTALDACILAAQESYLADATSGGGGTPAIVTPEELVQPEVTTEKAPEQSDTQVSTTPDTKTTVPETTPTETPATTPDTTTTTPSIATPSDTGGEVLGVSKTREETAPTRQEEQPELKPGSGSEMTDLNASRQQIDNLHLQVSALKYSLDKSNSASRIYLLLIVLTIGFSIMAFIIGWYAKQMSLEKPKKRTIIKKNRPVIKRKKRGG